MKTKNFSPKTPMLVTGIFGSLLFIYLGYLISGILGLANNGMVLTEAMATVVLNPFGNYFNGITPVTMIVGFVMFECLFLLILIGKNRNKEIGNNDSPVAESDIDIMDAAQEAGIDDIGINMGEIEDYDKAGQVKDDLNLEDSFVNPDDAGMEEKTASYSFSDDIVTELLNDFDLTQITAMLELKAYMAIEDAKLLKTMFRPEMSADTITAYINAFYG